MRVRLLSAVLGLSLLASASHGPALANSTKSADSDIVTRVKPKLKPRQRHRNITVQTTSISSLRYGKPDQTRFGKAVFVGGLVLSSPDRWWGGFSGVEISPDGKHLYAISDRSYWLQADLAQSPSGAPLALTNARMGELPSSQQIPLKGSAQDDTEALRIDWRRGALAVGYEKQGGALLYKAPETNGSLDLSKLQLLEILELDKQSPPLRANKSIEALARIPASLPYSGRYLAIAERAASNKYQDDRPAFLLGISHRSIGKTPIGHIKAQDGLDITDAVFATDGTLYILERRFSIAGGLDIRVRRIRKSEIRQAFTKDANGPNLLGGDEVFKLGFAHNIDNMEAIALHIAENGETYLTLLSDDNYNFLQRTVLLRFRLDQ
ncbi:esterase-like activity of phytase family protein [Polycladidibacter hongkongensis]|uniref:esterase-like activity of phytase family protein n=1 Tax=Polycladidibacter hongkongensis TaxID=1647556 RepID=UPI0008363F51|nr:esterase-like activity of phytase family protein [Pseudovibrio hongkongensis]